LSNQGLLLSVLAVKTSEVWLLLIIRNVKSWDDCKVMSVFSQWMLLEMFFLYCFLTLCKMLEFWTM